MTSPSSAGRSASPDPPPRANDQQPIPHGPDLTRTPYRPRGSVQQQKSKLSKVQSDEAASLLSQILISSVGPAYDTVEGFIRGLPADTTAKAVGDSWTQLPEATRRSLLNSLPDLPRGDRFDRLKLLAGAAIVDVDPQTA